METYIKQIIMITTILTYIKLFFNSLFLIKLDSSVIPKNTPYCYVPDVEKNNNKSEDDLSYYIKLCPYFKNLGKDKTACMYIGFIGHDLCHWDQCKICEIK